MEYEVQAAENVRHRNSAQTLYKTSELRKEIQYINKPSSIASYEKILSLISNPSA